MNINRPEWICTLCGFILKESTTALATNILTRLPQLADDVVCPDCCAPSNLFTFSLCVAWHEPVSGSAHAPAVNGLTNSCETTSPVFRAVRAKAQTEPVAIEFRKRKIGCYG